MPSRRKRPGKHGTAPQSEGQSKRQRSYARGLKETCARWLWEAERRRPESLHDVPLVYVDGARLLKEADYIELEDRDGSVVCRLKPAFKTWWCGYGTSAPKEPAA